MSQANVYTSVSDQAWYTDKALISTGNTAVTYNVDIVALNYIGPNGIPVVAKSAVGNIYSNAVAIAAYKQEYIYVGVGNKLTITGTNFTAAEAGTATSAQAGVIGIPSY